MTFLQTMAYRFRPMVFLGMLLLGGLGGLAIGALGLTVKDLVSSEEKHAALENGNKRGV